MKSLLLLYTASLALAMSPAACAADISLPKGTYSPNTHLMTLDTARENARFGDAQAQHTLSWHHEHGTDGARQDDRLSAEWCYRSASQGYPDAQFDMGRKYAIGQGVPKDIGKARAWYRKAAAQGNHKAQKKLEETN